MNLFIEWLYEEQAGYEPLITKAIEASLHSEGIRDNLEVSLTIVDDEAMSAINLEQRGKAGTTDVLSFPMVHYEEGRAIQEAIDEERADPESGLVYLGDIVISWDKVLEQKTAYGHSTQREFAFLIVHSMLHLLGYDHMTEGEEADMVARQKKIMSAIGVHR